LKEWENQMIEEACGYKIKFEASVQFADFRSVIQITKNPLHTQNKIEEQLEKNKKIMHENEWLDACPITGTLVWHSLTFVKESYNA